LVFISMTFVFSVGGWETVQAKDRKEIKDTIDQLSFSHDGKKILFDRCRGEDCQIQVYDLESGELSAYQSPPSERWTMARYSYDGKKIVFSAIPKGEKYLDLANMQVAVMDPDGKNVKKITSETGPKIYPVFSHSGKKVLYARADRIRKQGRTPASNFDAWEVDIKTGKETRLTYFKFFKMRSLSYFPDDERFIFQGTQPTAFPGLTLTTDDREKALTMVIEELKKNKIFSFRITTMKREDMLPYKTYSFAENIYPVNPLLSKDGTRLLFEGRGEKYYLYSPDGNHRCISPGGSVNSAAISPDGELLGVIYAKWNITIYRVQDGNKLEKLYLPRVQASIDYKDLLSQFKLLPEQPLRIINH